MARQRVSDPLDSAVHKTRQRELQLEGAVIRTSYGTGGRVVKVTGPYHIDPDSPTWGSGVWTVYYARPHDGEICWINEVYVENGRIYAHSWRDEIIVVEPARMQQMALF